MPAASTLPASWPIKISSHCIVFPTRPSLLTWCIVQFPTQAALEHLKSLRASQNSQVQLGHQEGPGLVGRNREHRDLFKSVRPVSNPGCLQHLEHLKTLRASQNSQVQLGCQEGPGPVRRDRDNTEISANQRVQEREDSLRCLCGPGGHVLQVPWPFLTTRWQRVELPM